MFADQQIVKGSTGYSGPVVFTTLPEGTLPIVMTVTPRIGPDAVMANGATATAFNLLGTNGVVHTLECVPEPRTTMFAGALRAGA